MNNLVVKDYMGSNMEFKVVDGCVYANATSMCKAFGKEVKHWLANESTKELINEVSSEVGIPTSQLILIKKGNSSQFEQGTWIHEELILELASWLNIKFRRWCQKQIATLLREGEVKIKPSISKEKRLEIMERNSKVRESKIYLKIAEMAKTDTFKNIMLAYGANTLAGKEILPLPEIGEKTLTADQIAKALNISSNKVGRLANKFGLKNDKNGIWVQDKKKHCDGEITVFRYYESAINEFKKVL